MGRIRLGRVWEGNDPVGRVEMYVLWRDIWIGAYVADNALYVCPLPMCVIRVSFGRRRP